MMHLQMHRRMRVRVGAWHAQCRLIMWHSYVPRGTGVQRFFTRCQFRNVTGVSKLSTLEILSKRGTSLSVTASLRRTASVVLKPLQIF